MNAQIVFGRRTSLLLAACVIMAPPTPPPARRSRRDRRGQRVLAPNGTPVLLDRYSVTADNVWFAAMRGRVSGPVVLLDDTFHGDSRARRVDGLGRGVELHRPQIHRAEPAGLGQLDDRLRRRKRARAAAVRYGA